MTVDSLVRTIGAILAPVVMVTSCSIALNGFFARYETLSARMRSMHRERLGLLDGGPPGAAGSEERRRRRIAEIERQLPGLLRRHLLIRNAVLGLACAVLLLVVGMFLIAAAEITHASAAASLAMLAFLAATASFLAGMSIATYELWRSQREVAYEIADGLMVR